MKTFLHALLLTMIAASPAAAQMSAPAAAPTPAPKAHDGVVHYQKFQDLKWGKLVPEQGAGSPEISILHVGPKTGATQLPIRTPKNYHAARHWHTANETHTVIYGTFMIKHDGEPQELRPGPWDLNLVDAPTVQKSTSAK